MEEFFGGRLLRWLTAPMRNRVVGAASRPFLTIADRVLGARFLQDIAEFFTLMQSMEKGFVDRARSVSALMADARTAFCVVTTLETAPAQEAAFFVEELRRRGLPLGAVIVNKAVPEWLLDAGPSAVAGRFCDAPGPLATAVRDEVGAPKARIRRVLAEVGESFANYAVVAARRGRAARRAGRRCRRPRDRSRARRAGQRSRRSGPPGPVLLALTADRRQTLRPWPPCPISPGSTPSSTARTRSTCCA